MFRVKLAGPDTTIVSSLCGQCPYGPRGCCVAPPRYAWSDVARVVLGGGRDWLVAAVARGALGPFEHGLRVARRGAAGDARCTFHDDARGCTLAPELRPATCNYYVCEPALDAAQAAGLGATVSVARAETEALVAALVAWDAELHTYVRSTYGAALPFDAPFLDDVAEAFVRTRRTFPHD